MINFYKEKYLKGELTGDYDSCRFAVDKVKYAKEWLKNNKPDVNFEKPQNIVDRICRYKLDDIEYPDIEYINLKSRWSDKVGVYDELENIGLKCLQMPLELRIYRKTFDSSILSILDKKVAENTFIIKCNHGSGWNLNYIPNKTKHEYIIENMNKWLNTNYAYISGLEMQYKWIRPGYVVQPVYVNKPLDWSFWCEFGEIKGVGLTRKIGKNYEEYIAFVNQYGKENDWYIGAKPDQSDLFPSQVNILKQMIPFVLKLIKPFKFVRCDMYYINKNVYFGELTFTPCSGVLDLTLKG